MRLGIVLAAGDSTRLPGKLLIPIQEHHHRTPVASAVRFLQRNGCDKVVAVVKQVTGPLAVYLDAGLHVDLFVQQPEAQGVTDALRRVQRYRLPSAWEPVSEYLIAFGDNVYPCESLQEKVPELNNLGFASVRDIDDEENQLDGWSIGERHGWVTRDYSKKWALAGWLALPKPVFDKVAICYDLIAGLNYADVQPILCGDGWWDIGTPAAYGRYWRTK